MLSNLLKISAVFSILQLSNVGAASAATIDIVRLATDPYNTEQGVRVYETSHPDGYWTAGQYNTGTEGIDLDGSLITATYADGSSEEIVWEALLTYYADGGGYYSIDGEADGEDTYMYMAWEGFDLTTTKLLTSLSINTAPSLSVFDTTVTFDDDPCGCSTQSSSFGFPFHITDGGDSLVGNIDVTYSGIVGLAGAEGVGDLFTTMTVDFSGLSGGGFLGSMSFASDLDTLADLTPVPLPASLPLLLVGLGGLGLSRRITRRG